MTTLYTKVIILLLAFASICLGADTAEMAVIRAAASRSGVTLVERQSYMLYEFWPAKGAPSDCVSGYAHVRVIVGSPQTLNGETDFTANAYDMVVSVKLPPDRNPEGLPVKADQESWEWYPANTYEYQGTFIGREAAMKGEGARYCQTNPKYRTRPTNNKPAVNCRTFADELRGKFTG